MIGGRTHAYELRGREAALKKRARGESCKESLFLAPEKTCRLLKRGPKTTRGATLTKESLRLPESTDPGGQVRFGPLGLEADKMLNLTIRVKLNAFPIQIFER